MDATSTTTPDAKPPRVLLIDLDNCPQQLAQLPENLAGFSRIVVCYGSQEPKLPLSLVTALAEPIMGGRLEIVGMAKNGKNAADFGLCFYAGKLMAQMPPETEFTLLSEDTDLDHAVNLLRDNGRVARRMNGRDGDKAKILSDSTTATAGQDYAELCLKPGRPRPASRATLLNSIKAFNKTRHPAAAEKVLSWLEEHGKVTLGPTGKTHYPDDSLPLGASEFDDDIPF